MAGRRFVGVLIVVTLALLVTAVSALVAIARARPSTFNLPAAHRFQLEPGTDARQSFFMPACTPHAVEIPFSRPTSGPSRVGLDLYVANARGWPAEPVFSATQVLAPGATHVIFELPSLADTWRRLFAIRLHTIDGVPPTIETRRVPPRWRGDLRLGSVWRGSEALPFDVMTGARARGVLSCVFDDNDRTRAWTAAVLLLVVVALISLGAAYVAAAPRVVPPDPAGGWAPHTTWLLLPATLATATGALWFLVVPPFEAPDEVAHAGYAQYVATNGSLPRALPEAGSPWNTSFYEWVQPPVAYVVAAGWLRWTGTDLIPPAPRPNPLSQVAGGPERLQFRHAEPDRTAATRALRYLRAINVGYTVIGVALLTLWLRREFDDPRLAVGAASALALVPQWGAILTMFGNDSPATLLATLAMVLLAGLAAGRGGARLALGAGVAIGLAVATKLTTAYLLLAAVAVGLTRGGRTGGGVRLALTAGVALTASWVHVRQWIVFGDPLARAFKRELLERSGFAALSAAQPGPLDPAFWSAWHAQVYEAFWARFGSLGAGPDAGSRIWWLFALLSAAVLILLAVGILALMRDWRRGEADHASRALLLLVALTAGLALWIGANVTNAADTIVHWTPRHVLPLSAVALAVTLRGALQLAAWCGRWLLLCRLAGAAMLLALGVGWFVAWRHAVQQFHFGYL